MNTCTHMTRFGNTAGLPVPLYNPSGNRVNTLKNENHGWAGGIQNESTGHTETIIAQHIQMRISGHMVDANCGFVLVAFKMG